MNTTWARAASRSEREDLQEALDGAKRQAPVDDLPSGVVPPPMPRSFERMDPGAPLILTDRFELGMVDMNLVGARLLVEPLSRPDAMDLVRRHPPSVQVGAGAATDRSLATFERELQMESVPRPKLRYGTRFLVMEYVKWNDVRWFLVTYEADGQGCIP